MSFLEFLVGSRSAQKEVSWLFASIACAFGTFFMTTGRVALPTRF